jgi:hypothetical protein
VPLYGEKARENADTLTIDPTLIGRMRQDFAVDRASGR